MIFIVDTDLNQFRFAAPSAEKCKEWIDQILRLLQRGHEKPPLRKSSVRKMIEEDQLVDFKNGTKVDIGGFGAPFSPRYGDESDRSDSYKQQGSADTSLELKDRDGADVSLASMSASGRSKSKRKNSTRKSSRTDSPSRSRSNPSVHCPTRVHLTLHVPGPQHGLLTLIWSGSQRLLAISSLVGHGEAEAAEILVCTQKSQTGPRSP